jgi:hypothetical protein
VEVGEGGALGGAPQKMPFSKEKEGFLVGQRKLTKNAVKTSKIFASDSVEHNSLLD